MAGRGTHDFSISCLCSSITSTLTSTGSAAKKAFTSSLLGPGPSTEAAPCPPWRKEVRGGRWEVDEEVEVDAVEYLLHLLHWSLGRSLGRRALSRVAPRPRPTPLRATPSAVILVVVVVVVMKEEVGVVEYLEHLQQFLLGAPLTPRRPNATHPALVEVVVVVVEWWWW